MPAIITTTAPTVPKWIEQLLASDVFAAQQKQVGRMAPAENQLRPLLALLDERRGSVMTAAVAQRLNIPEFRVSTILAAAGRVLNVEGYRVIALDDAAKTITLNFELLRAQFELED